MNYLDLIQIYRLLLQKTLEIILEIIWNHFHLKILALHLLGLHTVFSVAVSRIRPLRNQLSIWKPANWHIVRIRYERSKLNIAMHRSKDNHQRNVPVFNYSQNLALRDYYLSRSKHTFFAKHWKKTNGSRIDRHSSLQ